MTGGVPLRYVKELVELGTPLEALFKILLPIRHFLAS
jgi:hypothetical protein